MKLVFNRNRRLIRVSSFESVVPVFRRGRARTTKSHEMTRTTKFFSCLFRVFSVVRGSGFYSVRGNHETLETHQTTRTRSVLSGSLAVSLLIAPSISLDR